MKLKITHRTQNEIISQSTEACNLTSLKDVAPETLHHSLAWLEAYPLENNETKRVFIYYMFLKNSKIKVKINKGIFYYLEDDGLEQVFEQPSYDIASLRDDALNEALKNLDYRLVEIELHE